MSCLPAFSEGLAAIKMGGKWGFIDKTGKVVIPPQFDIVLCFSEGLAPIGMGGKWGFIDQTGKIVIPPQFDAVRWFSEGLAAIEMGGKWGFIDKKGRTIQWAASGASSTRPAMDRLSLGLSDAGDYLAKVPWLALV